MYVGGKNTERKEIMTEVKITDVVTEIVDILTPLQSEDRRRVIAASLTLLGEEASIAKNTNANEDGDDSEALAKLPPRARVWMKQNNVSAEELEEVFHISEDGVEVIAAEIPGKSDKEKTYSAYILMGTARLLATGTPAFEDKAARALCQSSGCYNSVNHSTYLKDRGNEFTGSKETGWTLTGPGLKRGSALVKELTRQDSKKD